MATAIPDVDASLALAMSLADAARPAALRHFRTIALDVGNKRAHEGAFDPVTVADREVEAEIRTILAKERPDDGIIGEEQPETTGRSGITWVIDPIDGTRSFLCGLPTWGVLIAMNDGTRPVIGVMDQPFTGERLVGVINGAAKTGFWKRGESQTPLETRRGVHLTGAIMCSTAPDAFASQQDKALFTRLSDKTKLTRFGTDCYGYAMLALGQIDLVAESGLSAYDIQAMIPIVEAAGGVITDWQGGDCQQGGQVLAAGDAELHAQAMELLSG